MGAVVVVFDRSLSMPMNGLLYAAQTRAISAIEGLDRSGSPDHLCAAVEFGARAGVVSPSRLSELAWDYEYGSNLADALSLSLSSLKGEPGRIVLCSDLFASAHTDAQGRVVFSCPPARETLDRTVDAIRACGDASITIEASRYRSGETREEEEAPVAVIMDAILASGGTIADMYIEDGFDGQPGPWRYAG
jgi:uncharacterized protein with von Willebrand factor type A (vWA) domain